LTTSSINGSFLDAYFGGKIGNSMANTLLKDFIKYCGLGDSFEFPTWIISFLKCLGINIG
jgi:hypothetical protein